MKPVVGVGAGGHAKVIIDILRLTGGYDLRGLVDADARLAGSTVLSVPVVGGDEELRRLHAEGVRHAFVGIASLADTRDNKAVFDRVRALGFEIINVIHPSAVVADSVRMGAGNRIFGGVVINPESVLGDNVVINTGAVVDHECRVEDHAQVAPGAQLAGNVHVGEGSIVGIGATVIQGVRIGRYAMVGAGAVVIREVPDHATVVGVPARPIERHAAGRARR